MTMKIRLLIAVISLLAAGSITMAAQNIIDCDEPFETDIAAILWNVANEYDDFEDFVEDHAGVNLKSCMRNRFESNGDVKCMDLASGKIGSSVPGDDKIKIDTDWLNGLPQIDRDDQKFRRACIVGTMAHEFAHSCYSTESRAEDIDNAAFGWWRQRFNATGYFSECPQD
jgi:hypothetical protein